MTDSSSLPVSESSLTTTPWHTLNVSEALTVLQTDPACGLTTPKAEERRAVYGPNQLPEKPPTPAWRRFLDQFCNLLIVVLIAAGILAGFVGDIADMLVIFGVVLLNAVLGFYQENRAEHIIGALKKALVQKARVWRDGEKVDVPSSFLVPGDIVELEPGDRLPADGRLLRSSQLEVDESMLTGESKAARKDACALVAAGADLGDRSNMGYMNTVVTRGRAKMVVTATGAGTEIGRIAGLLQNASDEQTPLQERLDRLGQRLALIAGTVVVLIFALEFWRGKPLVDIILTAVALAVAAIPEGLPAVVTVTLAIGMFRMARQGAVIKRLAAVETLGSTTVICTDKTGTLTMNQMTATAGWAAGCSFEVDGQGYDPSGRIVLHNTDLKVPNFPLLLRAGALCNDASFVSDDHGGRTLVGDPTEGALLVLSEKAGAIPDWPRLAEVPFDSERKIMITVHHADDGTLRMMVKGAPQMVLDMCGTMLWGEGTQSLTPEYRQRVADHAEQMAGHALRVLALAEGVVKEDALDDPLAAAQNLVLTALVGLMDPPRPEVRDAIAECHDAGIAVKMITGDYGVTAAAIGQKIGLTGRVLSGTEIQAMDDAQLFACVNDVAIFARVSPEHKMRIVTALRQHDHVTAMTGDGVNDAAALKQADIGIAMGRSGSDVTREAAAMVLTDDNFSTIVHAVEAGRTIYDNIIKFVRFQLSTNIGALLTVLTAPLFGLAVPFYPVQILWVNIIMDGPPAMSLGFDPVRRNVMNRPPRPRRDAILSWPRLRRLALHGLTMMAGTLGVYAYALAQGEDLAVARTLAFTTFVMFQVFNVFNARVDGHEFALSPAMFSNGKLWGSLLAIISLQIAAIYWPFAQTIFHTTALDLQHWGMAVGVASSIILLDDGHKLLMRLWHWYRHERVTLVRG